MRKKLVLQYLPVETDGMHDALEQMQAKTSMYTEVALLTDTRSISHKTYRHGT